MSSYDFPTPSEVKRKLQLFEDTFRRSLIFKYQSLDEDLQLSKVGVARVGLHSPRIGLHGRQEGVALSEYLDPKCNLPADLVGNYYRLTIPASTYRLLQYIKVKGIIQENLWRTVAVDIVDSIGIEVGRELSRIFEYQIMSLAEDVSNQLLAAHATDCIMEHVKSKNILIDRNTVLKGVISTRPPVTEELNTVFSVMTGGHESKWELYDIFKKPGLRREMEDTDIHNTSSDDEMMMHSVHAPYSWSFFTASEDCDSDKYGFRGQMLEWDFAANVYRLNAEEDKMYCNSKMYQTTDVHQHYVPYSHLVSAEKMQRYLQHLQQDPGPVGQSFTDFNKQERRYVDRDCDELLIYRPLSPLARDSIWTKAVLENMDLSRFQLQNEASMPHSVKNSRLLLANITHAHLIPETIDTAGCDLSYSTWVCYSSGTANQMRPYMICLEDVDDVDRSKDPGESMIMDKDGRIIRVEDGKSFWLFQIKMGDAGA